MENFKIPEITIVSIVDTLANQILSNLPQKNTLTGQEILVHIPHTQINNLIFLQLFQELNTLANHPAHPFFNINHPEVQNTFNNTKNTLQNHIQISKNDLTPILQKATFNSIQLLINPLQTLINFFFNNNLTIPTTAFIKNVPNIYYFNTILNTLISQIQHNPILSQQQFTDNLLKISQQQNNLAYQKEQFQLLTHQNLDDGLNPKSFPTNQQNPKIQTTDLMKNLFGAELSDIPTHQTQKNKNPLLSAIDYQPTMRANEKPKTNPETNSQAINIENIPLHKQFQYVQKIFNNSNTKFKNTIDHINTLQNLPEAELYLDEQVFPNSKIPKHDPVSQDFLQLIKNRF